MAGGVIGGKPGGREGNWTPKMGLAMPAIAMVALALASPPVNGHKPVHLSGDREDPMKQDLPAACLPDP